ncbi:O-fucosyltransferase family protein [Psidium guajava]|nr:O-fucosyltransferase family protein [Psidium guajava]
MLMVTARLVAATGLSRTWLTHAVTWCGEATADHGKDSAPLHGGALVRNRIAGETCTKQIENGKEGSLRCSDEGWTSSLSSFGRNVSLVVMLMSDWNLEASEGGNQWRALS